MGKSKKWIACFMAAAVGVSTVNLPCEAVKADETAEEADILQTEAAENAESGEYLIYVEENAYVSEEALENAQEVVSHAEDTVYEADLSRTELAELEQTDHIQVEENFFLLGAGSKKKKEKDSRREQYELKRKLREAIAEEESEEGTDWNYQMIRADGATRQSDENETPVKVAVLDSGVELLSGIPVSKAVNLVSEEMDLPYYMNDMTGHGTAAADIIHQICPQAEIYAVRVLDRENRGRLSDVVEGIYWCIEQDVDVINMSFGTPKESEILKSAISAAADAGILIVGSAGNGGSEAAVEYPAAYGEVVAVGAVDTSAQRTEESTTGPEVELAAPGEQILTKSMLGLETVSSGTSMAAPHVTGAAARLMQQDREKQAEEIRMVLDASGNPLGASEEYGYGLVDVEYAEELLQTDMDTVEKICEERERGNADLEQETREPVSTYEEVDYVEGRWKGEHHEKIIKEGAQEYGGFSATEIKLLKAGAVYPDLDSSGLRYSTKHPEWHGYYPENYVANFIFSTRIAKAGGNTSALTKEKGQSAVCFERMKKAISTVGINGVLWETIISSQLGLDYGAKSASTKKRWRQIFLYGMASHTATDAFAHSCYYKDGATGQMVVLEHKINKWADNVGVLSNRYECARATAYYVAVECQEKWVGDAGDFSHYDSKYMTGFYMGNVLYYAKKADDHLGDDWLKNEYQKINYRIPGVN